MQHILDFDWAVFQFVEKYLWCPFLDVLMPLITHSGDMGLVWIVLAVILLFFKKYRKFGVMMITGLLISLLINDNILKPLISRPRPFDLEAWKGMFNYPELIPHPDSLSFPSGHTSSSFAAAVVLIFTGKKRIYIPPLILAFLIAFSRIYVHVHYCTDVLAGMVVGALYALLAFLIVAKFVPFIQEKIKAKNKKEPA